MKKKTIGALFLTLLIGTGLRTVHAESRIIAFGEKVATSVQSRWNHIKEEQKKAWNKMTEEQKKQAKKEIKVLAAAVKGLNTVIPFIYFGYKWANRKIIFEQADTNLIVPLKLDSDEEKEMKQTFKKCGFKLDEIIITEKALKTGADLRYGAAYSTKHRKVIQLVKSDIPPVTSLKLQQQMGIGKQEISIPERENDALGKKEGDQLLKEWGKKNRFTIAHELGHLHYNHTQKITTALLAAPLISTVVLETYNALTKIVFDKVIQKYATKKESMLHKTLQVVKKTNSLLSTCFVTKIVLSWIFYYGYCRSNEKQADLFAAEKVGISSFELLDNMVLGLGSDSSGFFDKHPKRSTRINYLKAFQAKQSSKRSS